jgi:DNA-binding MarR family transcriptional regulator
MRKAKAKAGGDALQFMRHLWDLVHALDVRSKRMASDLGVTGPQRLVIRLVGQNPGQTATEISSAMGKHPSTLTGVLARLEQRSLLVREADKEDRRRARFRLTAAGKRIDRERKGTIEDAVRRAIGRAKPGALSGMQSTVRLLVEELERD